MVKSKGNQKHPRRGVARFGDESTPVNTNNVDYGLSTNMILNSFGNYLEDLIKRLPKNNVPGVHDALYQYNLGYRQAIDKVKALLENEIKELKK